MNDFTKEELRIILLDMNINIIKTTVLTVSKSYVDLRNKVESMIDNYCEHEWQHGAADCCEKGNIL